jgi:hypothetical protein
MKRLYVLRNENGNLIIPYNNIDYVRDNKTNVEINFALDRKVLNVTFNYVEDYEKFISNIFRHAMEMFLVKNENQWVCTEITVLK